MPHDTWLTSTWKHTPCFHRHGPLGAAGPEAAASLASIMIRLWFLLWFSCRSCASSRFECSWCIQMNRCVNSRRNCPSDAIVTGTAVCPYTLFSTQTQTITVCKLLDSVHGIISAKIGCVLFGLLVCLLLCYCRKLGWMFCRRPIFSVGHRFVRRFALTAAMLTKLGHQLFRSTVHNWKIILQL